MLVYDDSEVEDFFRGGHWGQCLELLSHLCRYSDSILLITGPTGIGKSSLKQALKLSEAENFSFCEIQATTSLNADGLMNKIDRALDVPLNNDLVLLIEDAENLSTDVVTVLLQLRQRLEVKQHMQIVLFAAPSFEQKMLKSVLKEDFTEQVHIIELEPLTLSEVEDFVTHQLRASDNHKALPFDKATYKKLYSMSGGIPGKLKNLIREFLADKSAAKVEGQKRTLSPTVVGSVVSIGLLFCLLAFLWPEADDSQIKSVPLKVAGMAIPKPDLEPEAGPELTAVPDASAQLELETEAQAQEAPQLVEASPVPVVQVAIDQEQKIEALEKKVAELQQLLAQATKKSDAKRGAELKTQHKAHYTTDEKFIMGAPSKNYTLQLMGSNNESKVREFIKEHKLSSKAHYFKSVYHGKPWFVVIYGNYASRSSAVSALDKLPSSMKRLQPWPREYTYIQRTIKKN